MMKKSKKYKSLLALSISILAFFSIAVIYFLFFRSNTNGAQESHFGEKTALVIVTDYLPESYFVQGDSVTGIVVDLTKAIQKYTNLELEIALESSLEKSIEGLYSGQYDIVARNIPVTSDLKDKVLFTQPIAQSKLVLVQRKLEYNDSILPIRSHLDLAGKTLFVSKKSPAILRINNLASEIGDTIYYTEDEVYGDEQLAIMVANKEIDLAVCNEKTAKILSRNQPELDLETNIGFTQFEAWAVSNYEPELLDSLNTWIDKAKQAKQIEEIYKNYLDK